MYLRFPLIKLLNIYGDRFIDIQCVHFLQFPHSTMNSSYYLSRDIHEEIISCSVFVSSSPPLLLSISGMDIFGVTSFVPVWVIPWLDSMLFVLTSLKSGKYSAKTVR